MQMRMLQTRLSLMNRVVNAAVKANILQWQESHLDCLLLLLRHRQPNLRGLFYVRRTVQNGVQ